ncbi:MULTISPECIES: nucleoside-diphosphate kinase [unclassified Nonomuraea]|uniref:nucleoside-diphosphate kinase n=1 Tax=unclassified Nonomuraea TaxID=2593643 RepID=UPI0033CC8BDA
MTPAGGWGYWTVVLCKPDATARNIVMPILEWIAGTVTIVQTREVVPTTEQILAHYADMLLLQDQFPFDVRADMVGHYVGSTVTVALGRGDSDDTPQRVRHLLGHYDPARAPRYTIRGHYGIDTSPATSSERPTTRTCTPRTAALWKATS